MSSIAVTVAPGGAGAPTLVTVVGDVDLATALELRAQLTPAVEAAAGHSDGLVLDLREVDYLDSSGLRLLAALAHELGEGLTVVAPEGTPTRRVLEVSHLTDHVTVAEAPPG